LDCSSPAKTHDVGIQNHQSVIGNPKSISYLCRMANNEELFKKIIAHAKEYGFVFQSSEIYDGLSAVYDYGQNGVELKNNIKEYWWKSMVRYHENIVGIDSAIFMHPTIWKASGHVDAFSDPMIDNKDSKKRYRADVLVEDFMAKNEDKIAKEVDKAAKRFGETFDETQYRATNPRVMEYQAKIDNAKHRLYKGLENNDLADIKKLIEDLEIVCPVSGSRNWTEVRQFNLMFSTQMGSVSEDANTIYLRPETAQGIFVNFLNVMKTGRMKIPFGIAQIGKAFRNEIVARQFIFRMREFEQMEMQFFLHPDDMDSKFEYWKEERMNWYLKALGMPADKLRFKKHEKLAHYAKAAFDIEYNYSCLGKFAEVEGIHQRGDWDLSRHAQFSGVKLDYFDQARNIRFVPHIMETSVGLNRLVLMILDNALQTEKLENGKTRTVLRIKPSLAPVKVAIFPLQKDEKLQKVAEDLYNNVKQTLVTEFDDAGNIGKMYRRQDEIGTPYCITVDFQTLEDGLVTIRDRDTMKQERIPMGQVTEIIAKRIINS
jgi:glycyl-tRNA synthetase